MAGSNFFLLFDDIATLLDDVSVMSKVALKKTAGVLGDDLALNAEQVAGVRTDREIPVVWAVAKGSFVNKLILVPSALLISWVAPWAITPLLMLGGLYLCFEGCEKLLHGMLTPDQEEEQHHKEIVEAVNNEAVDIVEFEKTKIKGAIRTDFILSAEIIVIALGTVGDAGMTERILVLSAIALLMTVGVYGLVAGIVKLDDLGLHLARKKASEFSQKIGRMILVIAPKFMKSLSIIGMIAMFLVGGGIVAHGVPFIHHLSESSAESVGGFIGAILPTLVNGITGIISGAVILGIVMGVKKLRPQG